MRVGWIAAFALVGAASCATGNDYQGQVSLEPTQVITAADYDEVLKRWTRHAKVYDKLDTKLFCYATFHSPEFRKAFLLHHEHIYGRGSDEARRLSLAQEGAEENLEFFFSAYTPDPHWNDFDSSSSIWQITLEGDDPNARVEGTISKLKINANLRAIYPYISDFAKVYAMRFPTVTDDGRPILTGQTKHMILRIVSAIGQAQMSWEFRPVSAPGP
jgi:hypothetical protein